MGNPFEGQGRGQLSKEQRRLMSGGGPVPMIGQPQPSLQDIEKEVAGRVSLQLYAERVHAEETNKILEESYGKFVSLALLKPDNPFARFALATDSSDPLNFYIGGKLQFLQNPEFLFVGQGVVEYADKDSSRFFVRETILPLKDIETIFALSAVPDFWNDRVSFSTLLDL